MTIDPYAKLREQLELNTWPDVYMFKFIVPNQSDLVARVTALFDEAAELKFRPSKNDKYISIGAKEMMLNVESIINKYKQAAEIDGLVAL
jgi:uncharacterized protein|tara:strand:+ start:137 stop:406 length:270 start_codon:yes stop_codon:yes gene_type:complete